MNGISEYFLRTNIIWMPKVLWSTCQLAVSKGNLNGLKEIASHFIDKLQSSKICEAFEKPINNIMLPIKRSCFLLEVCPSAVINQPDYFFKHGDEIFIEYQLFRFRFFHSGIYHQGGYVYHFISLPDASLANNKLLSMMRSLRNSRGAIVFDRWEHFISIFGAYGRIYRFRHFLRVRTGEEVIRVAREISRNERYFTRYDIRFCNCQHFTSYCSRGVAFSYDMSNKFKYLACSLLLPFRSSKSAKDSCPKVNNSKNSI